MSLESDLQTVLGQLPEVSEQLQMSRAAPGQKRLWNESDVEREETPHDGKRPGEFAPKGKPKTPAGQNLLFDSGVGDQPIPKPSQPLSTLEKIADEQEKSKITPVDGQKELFSALPAFGTVIPADQAKELVGQIRDGDESSKNGGRWTVRDETGPLVMSSLPTDFFDQFPDEDDGSVTSFIRSSTNPERVARYAANDPKKPVYVVVNRKQRPILSDGGHRLMAAIDRGDSHVPALLPQSLHEQIHGTPFSRTLGEITPVEFSIAAPPRKRRLIDDKRTREDIDEDERVTGKKKKTPTDRHAPESGWTKVGGSTVHVNDDGVIDKGCPGLKGEEVEDLIDESDESRERREARQAHAHAAGITGDQITAEQAKSLGSTAHVAAYKDAKEVAEDDPRPTVGAADVLRGVDDQTGEHVGGNGDEILQSNDREHPESNEEFTGTGMPSPMKFAPDEDEGLRPHWMGPKLSEMVPIPPRPKFLRDRDPIDHDAAAKYKPEIDRLEAEIENWRDARDAMNRGSDLSPFGLSDDQKSPKYADAKIKELQKPLGKLKRQLSDYRMRTIPNQNPKTQTWTSMDDAAEGASAKFGIPSHHIISAMPDAYLLRLAQSIEHESLKKRARQATRVDAGVTNRAANSGMKDWTTHYGFDETSRDFASNNPDAGLDPYAHETPQRVWDLINEGATKLPAKDSPEIAELAAQMISGDYNRASNSEFTSDEPAGWGEEDEYRGDDAGDGDASFDPNSFSRSLLDVGPVEFARVKPARNQSAFNWDEDAHPREASVHDGKKPGEFAPKQGVASPEQSVDPATDYKQNGTRSKAFKAWFGDWEHDPANASKVVDSDGEPQETTPIPGAGSKVMKDGKPTTVYHGTARGGFGRFDKSKMTDPDALLFGPGFYFTEDPSVADEYAGKTKWGIQHYKTKEEAESAVASNSEQWRQRYGDPKRNGMEDLTFSVKRESAAPEGSDLAYLVEGAGFYPTEERLNSELNGADLTTLEKHFRGIASGYRKANDADNAEFYGSLADSARGVTSPKPNSGFFNSQKTDHVARITRFLKNPGDALPFATDDDRRHAAEGLEKIGNSIVRDKRERKQVFLNIRNPFDADNDRIPLDKLPERVARDINATRTSRAASIRALQVESGEKAAQMQNAARIALEKARKSGAPVKILKDQENVRRGLATADPEIVAAWEGMSTEQGSHWSDYASAMSQAKYHQEMSNDHAKSMAEVMKPVAAYDEISSGMGGRVRANQFLADIGHDGITHTGGHIMGNGHLHRVWIAFEPNQIKAVNNQGTFNPEDDRLEFSRLMSITPVEFARKPASGQSEINWDESKHPRDDGGKFSAVKAAIKHFPGFLNTELIPFREMTKATGKTPAEIVASLRDEIPDGFSLHRHDFPSQIVHEGKEHEFHWIPKDADDIGSYDTPFIGFSLRHETGRKLSQQQFSRSELDGIASKLGVSANELASIAASSKPGKPGRRGILRSRDGRVIGYLTRSGGKIKFHDRDGRIAGTVNGSNLHDRSGRVIGSVGEFSRQLLEIGPVEFARIKPAAGQMSLFDEGKVNRETEPHDNKKPGEFAPKATIGPPAAKPRKVGVRKAAPSQAVDFPQTNTYGPVPGVNMKHVDGMTYFTHPNDSSHVLTKVPTHHVERFMDEISGRMTHPANSGHPTLDRVLSGNGTHIGKGHESTAFDAGNGMIVKAAVLTPFHINHGVRTPAEANKIVDDSVAVTKHLRSAGVPGILPQYGVRHDGRSFAVQKKVDTSTPLQAHHFQQLEKTIRAMHDAGYVVKDMIQAGLDHNGNAAIYDIGSAQKLEGGRYDDEDKSTDFSHLSYLAKKYGVDYKTPSERRAPNDYESMLWKIQDHPGMTPKDARTAKLRLVGAASRSKAVEPDMHELLSDNHADAMQKLDGWINTPVQMSRSLMDITPVEFSDQKRETEFHDGKKPGQFAPHGEHAISHKDVSSIGSVTVTRLSGDKVSTKKEARRIGMSSRGVHTNTHTGWPIHVYGEGVRHSSAMHGVDHRLLMAIPELIKNAIHFATETPIDEPDEITAVHRFYAPLRIDSDDHLASVVVKQYVDGENMIDEARMYHVGHSKTERLASKKGFPGFPVASSADEPSSVSIGKLIAAVNDKHPEYVHPRMKDMEFSRHGTGQLVFNWDADEHPRDDIGRFKDKLHHQIKEYLGDGSHRHIRDIHDHTGHTDHDPLDPLANKANAALKELRDSGQINGTNPSIGEPHFHMTEEQIAKHKNSRPAKEKEPEITEPIPDVDAQDDPAKQSSLFADIPAEHRDEAAKLSELHGGREVKKTKTGWQVRAPKGGKHSEVNNRFYPGGQFMPIHGLTEKKEPQPKREKPAVPFTPPKPSEDGQGRAPRAPMSADEIEELRRKREDEKTWGDIQRSPLGRLLDLGDKPRWKQGTTPITDQWREYAERVGPAAMAEMKAQFEKEVHENIDKTWAERIKKESEMTDDQIRSRYGIYGNVKRLSLDDAEWDKNQLKESADSSATQWKPRTGKAIEKSIPGTHYVRELIGHILSTDNGIPIGEMKRIGDILASHESASRSEMADPAEAKRAGYYPNKFPGTTASGKRVKAGDGWVKKNADGKYETFTDDDVKSAIQQFSRDLEICLQEFARHEFSSTQFNIKDAGYPRSQGSPLDALVNLAKSIPTKELHEGERSLRKDLHVTVKYGLHCDDHKEVADIVRGFGPVTVKLGKVSVFPADEKKSFDVVKVAVTGADIHRLNKLISSSTKCTDTYPEYRPHITLAYVMPGLGKKYAGNDSVDGMELTFDTLQFSNKDREKIEIPLIDKAEEFSRLDWIESPIEFARRRPDGNQNSFGWSDEEQETPVESSNVHSFAWQGPPATGSLMVRFKNKAGGAGPMYRYHGTPHALYDGMAKAASKGKFVWDSLRMRGTVSGHQFPYSLVHTGDTKYVPRQAGLRRGYTGEHFMTRTLNGVQSQLAPGPVKKGPPRRIPGYDPNKLKLPGETTQSSATPATPPQTPANNTQSQQQAPNANSPPSTGETRSLIDRVMDFFKKKRKKPDDPKQFSREEWQLYQRIIKGAEMEDGFRKALDVLVNHYLPESEFARKPAAGQRGFNFDEDAHPRETTAHDGKKPGEFSPKSAPNQSTGVDNREPTADTTPVVVNGDAGVKSGVGDGKMETVKLPDLRGSEKQVKWANEIRSAIDGTSPVNNKSLENERSAIRDVLMKGLQEIHEAKSLISASQGGHLDQYLVAMGLGLGFFPGSYKSEEIQETQYVRTLMDSVNRIHSRGASKLDRESLMEDGISAGYTPDQIESDLNALHLTDNEPQESRDLGRRYAEWRMSGEDRGPFMG